jgi:RNA processing factor Prp31
MVLFETKVDISKSKHPTSNEGQEIIVELQKIFNQVDSSISLVKGKIREIYLSFST